MKKKILSALIVLCMLMSFGVVPLSVGAETEFTEGYYTYTVTNGEATITDYSGSVWGTLQIPSTLGGYAVTTIGYMAFYNCCFNSIIIPESVTNIGKQAFSSCVYLNNISIPGNVKIIDEYAFSSCALLKSVTILDGVNTIGIGAFSNCRYLSNLLLPDTITSIGNGAFYYCEKLFNITLPKGITSISDSLFYKSGLRNIIIPHNVVSIGDEAFRSCSIESITIPNGIKNIGVNAFFNCYALEEVNYIGSKEEWNSIKISSGNEEMKSKKRNYIDVIRANTEIFRATSTNSTLKFDSSVSILGEPKISTFGTTFIPLWLFEEGSTDVATVEYDNTNYDIQNGQTFGATLTGIPSEYKDMDIVGKSFVKTADGSYTWSDAVYSSVNNPTLKTIE